MSKTLKFYDEDGDLNELYHKDFNPDDLGTYEIQDKNDDPRKKLAEMMKKEELEKIRKKKKPIVKYTKKDKEKKIETERKSLGINPNIIVVPKDPNPKNLDDQLKKVIKISDIPRRNLIFKKDMDNDLYIKQLREQCNNEDEYNQIMLINEINLRHPRSFNNNGFPLKYNFCEGFGFFGWFPKFLFGEFSKFGEGLCDYFRLLKVNFIFFILICVFDILLLNFYGDDKKLFKKDIKEVFGYNKLNDFFTRYTLSNILVNNYYLYDIINIQGNQIKYTYSCPNSNNDNKIYQVYKNSIVKCLFFSQDLSESQIESSISNLVNYQRFEKVKNEMSYLYWENITGIKNSTICEKDHSSCTIDFSKYNTLIQPNYSVSDIKVILFQYQCVYNHNMKHSKKTQNIFLTLDYIIIFLLIGYVNLLFIFHWYSLKVHKDNYYQTNQYTVYVSNVEISPTPPDFYKDLNLFLQTITNAAMYQRLAEKEIGDNINKNIIYDSSNCVYQICYSLFDYNILDLIIGKRNLLDKYEIPNYYNKKANIFTSSYANSKYNLDLDHENKYEINAKLNVFNNNIHFAEKNKDNLNINDIFITFKTKGHAEKCYNCYHSKNWLYRVIIYIICRSKEIKPFYYKNKWLNVQYMPPESDGLKYENLRYPNQKRFAWKIFNFFIIFIFIIISLICYFIGVISVRKFNKTFNNYLNCNYILQNNNNQMTYSVIYNEFYNLNNKKQVNTFCFCKYYFFKEGKKKTKEFYISLDDSGIYNDYTYNGNLLVYPCLDWINKMDNVNKTYLWIYIINALLNIIFLKLVPFLVILERRKTLMEERVKIFQKVFFCCLFFNCLNPILSHANISLSFSEKIKYFPIFTGDQITFNTEWYYYVSTIITMNIIIGIILPFIIDYIKWVFILFVRKCLCKDILEKKNKYQFLYWFIGPEFRIEIKMGYQLSLFCSCLLCGFLITNPIATFTMAIISFIHFYLDKILFLKYFKNPLNYNQDINKSYIKILYIFTIIGILINAYYIGLFYLHIPSMLSIKDQINIMIRNPIIISFICFSGLMIIVPFIYFQICPLLIFCMCKKRDIAYGFAMDEAFEENSMNDFTIYESLPLSIIYKNYVIRKLEFLQASKYSLDLDLTFLLRYYRKKLDVDREAIAEKLDVITGQKCAINDDFDNIIKNIMDNIIEDDETKIKGNFSYNMSYFEVFQTIYLNEMLKN